MELELRFHRQEYSLLCFMTTACGHLQRKKNTKKKVNVHFARIIYISLRDIFTNWKNYTAILDMFSLNDKLNRTIYRQDQRCRTNKNHKIFPETIIALKFVNFRTDIFNSEKFYLH